MLLADAFCAGRNDERAGFKEAWVKGILIDGHVVKAMIVALKSDEGGAVIESFITYCLYTFGDVHKGQVLTFRVFVFYFISMIYALNGIKVKT